MRTLGRRVASFGRALAGFLRGFVGPARLPREPGAAREALEERSAKRSSCC